MPTTFFTPRFIKLLILADLFFLSAFITYKRVRVCETFGVTPLASLPLSGFLHGWSPYLFTRLMHNLTHPLCLLAYAATATLFTLIPFRRPQTWDTPTILPFSCVACLFHICAISYFISVLLPIGTTATAIATH